MVPALGQPVQVTIVDHILPSAPFKYCIKVQFRQHKPKAKTFLTSVIPSTVSEIFLHSNISRVKHLPKVLLPKKDMGFEKILVEGINP